MTPEDYMKELEQKLRRLPLEERTDALSYYEEYVNEAEAVSYNDCVQLLGTPRMVTSEVLASIAGKRLTEGESSAKQGISALWLIVLAIFASPIALPLALAAAGILFALAATVVALLFSGVMVILSLGLSGLFVGWLGIQLFTTDWP
ncbi:MAG: DUF1700 domain-containing protein, partial [Bacilli bacterium]